MKFLQIAKKDLKAEFRTKQMLNSMVIFALLVIVIFSFAFGNEATIFVSNLNKKIVDLLAPGMLWIAFTFAGMLGLSRSFAGEKEEGCLEGLKLCPADRSAIYNGKVLSNAVLMFLMEMATLPIFVVLFTYDIKNLPGLIVVIILGTLGFIFVGTLLSALTVNTRTREILLPVILFPVLIPVILSAVTATGTMLANGDFSDVSGEMQILVVYDIIFFVVAQMVFEYTIED
ncbi:MAG: Heme exporter, protein B [Candidatus Methanoperedens nitroreducens]|uniref:Heme exporter protein B n=1 Tax=Candidatus Methanoperedens nitratireducens TaxID=1392998 RepID=A0A0P8C6K9_9EURY|nr:heme exporter protein CcmB [Candidatus Methanoperedens sp. BLZ2]KAB2947498.1 MAG: heme exporter protein CcmB [Candidatus Methanoperedens sp.]KPQ42372.1 MAG: Heme exporter, protein B [Candidatus Methanoperedens sp. BLZ1]MBZ0175123.1 heme exporter protein CcmB [Candidatus Methanoperedens nitroreducens]MCX9078688.1 heme exporter protein CcmB [Candidatus Methanoperedens sp.]